MRPSAPIANATHVCAERTLALQATPALSAGPDNVLQQHFDGIGGRRASVCSICMADLRKSLQLIEPINGRYHGSLAASRRRALRNLPICERK